MAAINVVQSQELVAHASDSAELNRYQNKLDDAKDRVQAVRNTLNILKAHEITPSIAFSLDRQLERSDVEIAPAEGMDVVEGAEALGFTLLPREYIVTRLAGCESFLEDFFKRSRQVVTQMSISFREAYILLTQSQDALEKQVDLLENSINTTPAFNRDLETINLGERLFNLFKVNGEVNGEWVTNLGKLSRTISGLSNNYHLNAKNNLNSTLSYFGGFSGLDQQAAEERFLLMPKAIPSERFKECTYPNRVYAAPGVTAKQSVELMGGAYFVDVRQDSPVRDVKTLEAAEDSIQRYVKVDFTGFENNAPMVFPKLGMEIKSLSQSEIKSVTKLLREVLKDWRKSVETTSRYQLSDPEYLDIVKGFVEADISTELKDRLLTQFNAVIRKNQLEMLNVRAAVNSYLVLIFSGMVELCYTSIKVNTP
jgi:hypothetical protein